MSLDKKSLSADLSQSRTTSYLRHLRFSLVFKCLAVLATFIAVPLTLHWLGPEKYGIWSTILSVVSWIVFFDLGVGNGLKNRLAEAIATQQPKKAAHSIACAYSLMALISLGIVVSSLLVSPWVPWQEVFNSHVINTTELAWVMNLTIVMVACNFFISLINPILYALQKSALAILGQLINNGLALAALYWVSHSFSPSLVLIAVIYALALTLPNIGLSLWLYHQQPDWRPTLRWQHLRNNDQLTLGLQFFILQLAVIFIFATDKIMMSQFFGPEYVASYDVLFKYFSIVTLLYSLISTPLTSSYTDAFHREDFAWIRRTLYQQFQWFLTILAAVALMVFVAPWIIRFWVGHEMQYSMALIMSLSLFILMTIWVNIFATLVNGIGHLKPQLYCLIFAMLINIPLAWALVHEFHLGVEAIPFSSTLSLLPFAVIGPIQVFSLLKEKFQHR
jgi:O-antigen/teichoic acid export membrane protein